MNQIVVAGVVGFCVYTVLRSRDWPFLAAWGVALLVMLPIWIIGDIIRGPIIPIF